MPKKKLSDFYNPFGNVERAQEAAKKPKKRQTVKLPPDFFEKAVGQKPKKKIAKIPTRGPVKTPTKKGANGGAPGGYRRGPAQY